MCLLKDAIYVNFISIDLMKWRLWLVLSIVSYNIHLIAIEKLTKMCSTLGGHLSPQFCIFSWTELLTHVREQSALQGSCISRASSAKPVCNSHCNPPGVVFPRRETGLRRLMYWFTVSGNTVRRSLVQAQAESPDTFRHSSSPSQVSVALLGLRRHSCGPVLTERSMLQNFYKGQQCILCQASWHGASGEHVEGIPVLTSRWVWLSVRRVLSKVLRDK